MTNLLDRIEVLDLQKLRQNRIGFWTQPEAYRVHFAARGFLMSDQMPVNATKRMASLADKEYRNDWNPLNTVAVMFARHAFQQHLDGNQGQCDALILKGPGLNRRTEPSCRQFSCEGMSVPEQKSRRLRSL